ncbi:MAG: tryptophan halogenase family protein [Sphingomonas sp.]|uniref:tryptophan halogenase family protein n=1 Tax=Sphingomonas sp. TaxID=28214 RepID=UPI003F7F9B49
MGKEGQAGARRIGIIGGGSAGWMAAAAFANALERDPDIFLIESDEIGTVGVGEATIPPIKMFNYQLGIDENDFLKATQGSFKLGIEFVGWGGEGRRFFHPFGSFGAQIDRVPIHQFYFAEKLAGRDPGPLDDLSMGWGAASRGRFSRPVGDRRQIQSTFDYAYHFDAGLYARYLRNYAEARGVTRHEGRLVEVRRRDDGGVAAVATADGRLFEADFWIDCSGFAALLTNEVGWEDYGQWLPCDRAVAVPCARAGEFTPYTRSTARAAGWQWRIPLQNRIGNGHVYSSRHMSDDEATAILLANLDGEPLADPRLLRFRAGRRRAAWSGNCVALGLAAGFMEPLESTSLHLVQTGIIRLLALFPFGDARDEHAQREYNRVTEEEYSRIRDFLILHYFGGAERRSEPLWREAAAMRIPDSLAYRIAHFRDAARLLFDGHELFQDVSWLAIYVGQGIMPDQVDPLVRHRDVDATGRLATLRRLIADAAAMMPTHEVFVDRYCKAEA